MPQSKKPVRRAPSGKTKLLSLHLDGKHMNVGMADMLHDIFHAVANRSQRNLEVEDAGNPVVHINTAGDVCVYVNDWSV